MDRDGNVLLLDQIETGVPFDDGSVSLQESTSDFVLQKRTASGELVITRVAP